MATTSKITKNLGGDRLGSGSKNNITLHGYSRSNHDLSRAWRSSMNCGTLVPFMKILGLNGDTFSIDLNPIVRTTPTVGPLYGAYKLQLDVFECPIRLYNGLLHNNMLKIGLNMKQVKLPTMFLETRVNNPNMFAEDKNLSQISTSSLLHYLGIKGIGDYIPDSWGNDSYKNIGRIFNAVPYLAYWDIYKNYYANKQEEKGVCITKDITNRNGEYTSFQERGNETINYKVYPPESTQRPTGITIPTTSKWQEIGTAIRNGIIHASINTNSSYNIQFEGLVDYTLAFVIQDGQNNISVAATTLFPGMVKVDNRLLLGQPAALYNNKTLLGIYYKPIQTTIAKTRLEKFPLDNIDQARIKILQETGLDRAIEVRDMDELPYNPLIKLDSAGYNYMKYPQNGLGIKTYQSDLLQNWLRTEWIDGENGINQITAIDVSSGSFQIDALNLANKVYNMLNRIAVSGGTYEDWQEAVYSTEVNRRSETPIYKGGMASEIVFEEVVSTAATDGEPLGTLAGKGRTAAERGGHIEIRCTEPCYIIGIVSITPRVDYSQGNDWDMCELTTMDDMHKPALDGIGFEDLLQERAAWFGSWFDEDLVLHKEAMGKTPAWMNYMTAVNECHGDFAEPNKAMWMTLNRRYENNVNTKGISDLTTYIDPSKYNYTFADASLESQNFWVQIGIRCMARRVMSAKILPNL